MERGSDKHGAKLDDEMEREIQGMLKGGHPTRANEELEGEPTVTDSGESAFDRDAVQRADGEEGGGTAAERE
ncbi:hypothetical protein CLV63_11355 [Murinocardiopsis flavida]|uniref:Uncharacterized protein n=1 Tax=Murinocardiopsis flavida TaxID=645275 RepID=A0A2P8DFA7_9ACTN|nr:hypothetical protein [Murinocardiopsis flavida]PSK95892.1 hypothetical protein CLV63_11355 [Murinocardiopsis flavida]